MLALNKTIGEDEGADVGEFYGEDDHDDNDGTTMIIVMMPIAITTTMR